MAENTKKNCARIVGIILSLYFFLCFTPGAAKEWYQIGAGFSYAKQMKTAGVKIQQSIESSTHDEMIERAKRNGIIHSALRVNGLPLPLLLYLILTVIMITTPFSKSVNKDLFFFFPIISIWGIVFFGFANLFVHSAPIGNEFLGASAMWVVLTLFFGGVLSIGLCIRRILAKWRNASCGDLR